jgi:hypothetical protein
MPASAADGLMLRVSISTYMFAIGPNYVDLSSAAVPSGLSSGSCHFYAVFDAAARSRLHADLYARLTDTYDLDASARLRVSSGCNVARLFANCIVSGDGNMSLGAVGRDVGVPSRSWSRRSSAPSCLQLRRTRVVAVVNSGPTAVYVACMKDVHRLLVGGRFGVLYQFMHALLTCSGRSSDSTGS